MEFIYKYVLLHSSGDEKCKGGCGGGGLLEFSSLIYCVPGVLILKVE